MLSNHIHLDFQRNISQKRKFIVIGRGENSAKVFQEKTGLPVNTGGLREWLNYSPELPEAVIVATNIIVLAEKIIVRDITIAHKP